MAIRPVVPIGFEDPVQTYLSEATETGNMEIIASSIGIF